MQDDDHVLMSAEACLAGLFPPQSQPINQIWNAHIDWQPIPVHTQPKIDDPILETDKPCANYNALHESIDQIAYAQLRNQFEPLFKYIEENSGEKITALSDLLELYETLNTEKMHGFW